MINLAEKLNDQGIKLHNIYFYKAGVYEEQSSETLLERFPNLFAQDIIKD